MTSRRVDPHIAALLRDAIRSRRRGRGERRFDNFVYMYAVAWFAILVGSLATEALRDQRTMIVEGGLWESAGIIGLALIAMISAGLRSGARGGPMNVDAAEVYQWWLGPLPRRTAMSRPLGRAAAAWSFTGAAFGAGAASLTIASPIGSTSWITALMTGAAVGAAAAGAALWVFGHSFEARSLETASFVMVTIGLLEAANRSEWLPTTWIGAAISNGQAGYTGIVSVLVAGALTLALGARTAPGGSTERMLKRAQLVQQMRLAAIVQDLRMYVLLRRRLSQDIPRHWPVFRLQGGLKGQPTLRRALQSLLRWPMSRLSHCVALAVAGGALLAGYEGGPGVLLALASAAMWAIGLEITESLAQDVDRGQILSMTDRQHARHLLVAFVLALPLVAVTTCVYALVAGAEATVGVAIVPSIAASAVVSGTITAVRQPDYETLADPALLVAPEVAGINAATTLLLPMGVASLGFLPLVSNEDTPATLLIGVGSAFAVAASGWIWLRLRLRVAQLRRSMRLLLRDWNWTRARSGLSGTRPPKAALERSTPLALSFRGAQKEWGGAAAVGPIDLDFPFGELVALVGRNGAGKTTLLRLAAGLYDLSAGTVRVGGHPAGSLEARAQLSVVVDTPLLFDDLSIREQCYYVSALSGVPDPDDAAELILSRLGLAGRADDIPARLSLGMRQRAAIALALVRPFRILVADEPFRGLDARSAESAAGLLAEASKRGAAVLVSTHDLGRLSKYDRVIALSDGEVKFDGRGDDESLGETLRSIGLAPE